MQRLLGAQAAAGVFLHQLQHHRRQRDEEEDAEDAEELAADHGCHKGVQGRKPHRFAHHPGVDELVLDELHRKIDQQSAHRQQAAAQIEVEKPFPQEEELAEKSARLAELNAQLDVDEKSHDPEQDEEEQEDAPRRPSVLAALEEKSDKPEPVKPLRSYYDKDGDAR